MVKKIKRYNGCYEYKSFIIEKIEGNKHWNIGSEFYYDPRQEDAEIEWHDGADTLKDAIWLIDSWGEK